MAPLLTFVNSHINLIWVNRPSVSWWDPDIRVSKWWGLSCLFFPPRMALSPTLPPAASGWSALNHTHIIPRFCSTPNNKRKRGNSRGKTDWRVGKRKKRLGTATDDLVASTQMEIRVKKGCLEPRLAGPQSERAIMGSKILSVVELRSRSRATTGRNETQQCVGTVRGSCSGLSTHRQAGCQGAPVGRGGERRASNKCKHWSSWTALTHKNLNHKLSGFQGDLEITYLNHFIF